MVPPPKPRQQPAMPGTGKGKVGRKKKNSQPTQKTPMQRIKIVGADGKIRWEWRPWETK